MDSASTSVTPLKSAVSASHNDNSGVDSWLATSADWRDPAELQQAQDTTSHATTTTTTTPSPGALHSFKPRREAPGRNRKRQRRRQRQEGEAEAECERGRRWRRLDTARGNKSRTVSTRTSRSMDNDDTTSITSGLTSATSAIERREILTAVGPSKKRTGSPVRHQLTQLRYASPPLLVCQPGTGVELPPAVSVMKKSFVEAVSRNIIPWGLEDRLRAQDVDQFEASTHLLESASLARDSSYLTSLWQTVESIYDDAENAGNEHQDESMWIEVVRSVLKASHSPNLELHSIQTQSIKPSLIPRHTHLSFDKKADLALFFSPKKHDAIRRVYERRPGLALSHMMDACTSQRPVACGLEVKEQGGDYNVAVMQLGIWCAASLELVQTLFKEGGAGQGRSRTLRPMVGWTVVGHDWKLHIAWKADNGSVTLVGPWPLLTGSTINHFEILRLISLIKVVTTWQENEYWPWLRKDILDQI
ncbi:hypothetical protein BKA65DRAFT_521431 [Rhexocercosporidium sp. MPI-PUGE-AT-0058]|nr:hypothetical protein BKA65DRAFT_521431 [Rhexocercosporidium sp. MPI-PUGE-AT-0058]